jgi:hypothetical protein
VEQLPERKTKTKRHKKNVAVLILQSLVIQQQQDFIP